MCSLQIGFQLSAEVVEKPYLKHFEEISHLENQGYSRRTGEKLPPKKIIDQRGGEYFQMEIKGFVWDNILSVIQEDKFLGKELGCLVQGDWENNLVQFYLDLGPTKSLLISQIEENKSKLLELKTKLEQKFNIIVEPEVFPVDDYQM